MTNKDFARFVEIAYGSTMEVVSQMFVSKRRQFMSEEDFHILYDLAGEVARMESGLRASLVKDGNR